MGEHTVQNPDQVISIFKITCLEEGEAWYTATTEGWEESFECDSCYRKHKRLRTVTEQGDADHLLELVAQVPIGKVLEHMAMEIRMMIAKEALIKVRHAEIDLAPPLVLTSLIPGYGAVGLMDYVLLGKVGLILEPRLRKAVDQYLDQQKRVEKKLGVLEED